MKFPLGEIVATPGALDALSAVGHPPATYLRRHVSGDWGELSDGDKELNEAALLDGDRILSHYQLGNGQRIYVITEWDRSVTTILLPDEY